MIDTGIKAHMPGFRYPKSSKNSSFVGPRSASRNTSRDMESNVPFFIIFLSDLRSPRSSALRDASRSEVASTAPFGCFKN